MGHDVSQDLKVRMYVVWWYLYGMYSRTSLLIKDTIEITSE